MNVPRSTAFSSGVRSGSPSFALAGSRGVPGMWITTPRREGSGSEHAQGFDLITKARGLLASIIFPQAHTVGMVPILACKQGESMTAKRRPLTEAPDDLTTEEKVASIVPIREFSEAQFVLFVTRKGLIKRTDIIADSLSGVSGAGRKADLPYLYAECNESLRPYGVPKHRHLSEIEQELSIAANAQVTLQFTPHLVPVTRGILSTLYLAPAGNFETEAEQSALSGKIAACYKTAYDGEPFVRLLLEGALPDTKHVIHTNYLDLAWRLDRRTGRLIVMSAIDNLVKGASGQAVQCLNILKDWEETTGLI